MWEWLDKADQLISTDIYARCKALCVLVVLIGIGGGTLMVGLYKSSYFLKSPKLIALVCVILIVTIFYTIYALMLCL